MLVRNGLQRMSGMLSIMKRVSQTKEHDIRHARKSPTKRDIITAHVYEVFQLQVRMLLMMIVKLYLLTLIV